MLEISFVNSSTLKADALVVFVSEGKTLMPLGKKIDAQTQGTLTRALKSNYFKGKVRETLLIHSPFGLECSHILLLGLGQLEKLRIKELESIGAQISSTLMETPTQTVEVILDDLSSIGLDTASATAHLASGALLRSWRFDKYKTKEEENKPQLSHIRLVCENTQEVQQKFERFQAVAEGVFLARELVSEPPNIINPETFVQKAETLKKLGLTVKILEEKEMKKLGFNALLGVGQGSTKESYLALLQWNGGKSGEAPLAFVGKGVCFDTGGINLKPGAGMEEMKTDMAGAGAVIGLMKSLAIRRAKVNAVGVLALVENMPSGAAQRPSDVVTSLSGQTIEILNTDAEGRLILADALWYTQDQYNPRAIIDLATLTGAMVIALGSVYAGIFSNDEKLAKQVYQAGQSTGERVWQMPLDKAYNQQLSSPIADVANLSHPAREAGSITAAEFLQRFVQKGIPWAHIDIAGVVWSKKSPLAKAGAVGFGVRLLDELIYRNYEEC